jgi:hypothetical protein
LSKLDSGVESNIGIINCNIVLKSEECTRCKSCKHIFGNSVIKRHLRKIKCRKDYNDEDLKILSEQSLKRRKERQSITEKMKYDAQARAKKAKKHKDTYDPKKNKQAYNPQNRAKKYKADMAKSSRNERKKNDDLEMIENYNQDSIIKMRKKKDAEAKEINFSKFMEAYDYFQKCLDAPVCDALISTNFENKVRIVNLQYKLEKKYEQLKIEIEAYADNAKLMKGFSEVVDLYRRLMGEYNYKYEDNILKNEWQKICSEIELVFLKISRHVKIFTFKSKWSTSEGEFVPEYDAPKIVLGTHRLMPTQEKYQEEHICIIEAYCNASKRIAEFYESKQ